MSLQRLAIAGFALVVSACASTGAPPQHDLLNAALWMQTSVEYKAAARGAFALARLRLDEALADPDWRALPDLQGAAARDLPPAVIVDADETMIDNSPYQAWQVLNDAEFDGESWNAFVEDEISRAVPGALDFARYAAEKSVALFYVTNRDAATKPATLANLRALGFPVDDNIRVMTKYERPDWPSRKETRMAEVAKTHRVLLLIGDNLGDFTDAYGGSPEDRLSFYESNRTRWGREWIALPNPAYGSWESALYGHDHALPREEKRRLKREKLEAWTPTEDE